MAEELRARVAGRADVRAVYWLTVLHDTPKGSTAQDELHFELAEPPEEAAGPEQYRELRDVLPATVGSTLTWSIAPERILPDVRRAGVRVA